MTQGLNPHHLLTRFVFPQCISLDVIYKAFKIHYCDYFSLQDIKWYSPFQAYTFLRPFIWHSVLNQNACIQKKV